MKPAGSIGFSKKHGILVFFSLFVVILSGEISQVGAQPPRNNNNENNNGYPYAKFSPSMAIIIVVLIAALFFMGFFSIYIRHCSDNSRAAGSVRRALSRRTAAARGLDASVIETFPTFSYSEVKDHKIGKGTLECAVCLNEFEDNETLRLIPKCDHVFHPECIDAWLESHVTCPVCPANLAPVSTDGPTPEPESSNTDEVSNEGVDRSGSLRQEEVVIQVTSWDENRPEGAARQAMMRRNSSLQYPSRPPRAWSVRRPGVFGLGKFRSHSTGHSLAAHSLVVPGENLDRFTLRLPQGVRKEVMDRAMLNRTKSYAATLPREDSSKRGARSYQQMEKSELEVRSDRWTLNRAPSFFSRVFSMKSPRVNAENNEGSTSGASRAPVKMPSFKRLEPKTDDEAHLVSNDSIRHPV